MDNQSMHVYPYIPLKAYIVFFPLIHVLDITFLLLSITGIILVFTLLRAARTTDEVNYITVVIVCNLASLYIYLMVVTWA